MGRCVQQPHAVARRALNLLGAAAMRQRLAIQHQSLGAYLPLSTRPKANAPDESRASTLLIARDVFTQVRRETGKE